MQSHLRVLTPLSPSFVPGDKDVVCARGKTAMTHVGNQYFTTTSKKFLRRYTESNKVHKSKIVTEIIDTIQARGDFVKKVDDQWFLADAQLIREKVSQCLRNLLHSQYRSSTKAKKMSRQARESQYDDQVISQINCGDMVQQVKKLTAKARTEDDFHAAFLAVNIDLLRRIKMIAIEPLKEGSSSNLPIPLCPESGDISRTENDDAPLPLSDEDDLPPIPVSCFSGFPLFCLD